jgi:hypothetical protein
LTGLCVIRCTSTFPIAITEPTVIDPRQTQPSEGIGGVNMFLERPVATNAGRRQMPEIVTSAEFDGSALPWLFNRRQGIRADSGELKEPPGSVAGPGRPVDLGRLAGQRAGAR